MKKLFKIMLCFACVLSLSACKNEEENNNNTNNENQDPIVVEPVKTSITLSFAGDVTLGNYVGQGYSGSFNHEYEKQGGDASYFLKNVKSVFENDDLTIVNLEGPLTTYSSYKEKTFSMCGKPEYVDILLEGDIEVVSLANNHTSDRHQQGLDDTRDVLTENGIKHFGYAYTHVEDVKGIKVGFAGIYFPNSYTEEMNTLIQQLNNEADIVIVYFHWGIEGDRTPTGGQRDIAKECIDNGVDLVIGAHPHVLQKTETYKGKKIIYSLGNFCFGGNKNPSDKDTAIYQHTFNFEDKELVSESNEFIPCRISSTTSRNNYQPTIVEGEAATRVLNKLKEIE